MYIHLKNNYFTSIIKYLITIHFKPKHTQTLPVGFASTDVSTDVTATHQYILYSSPEATLSIDIQLNTKCVDLCYINKKN
jgi:hypothetical protein